MSLRLPQSAFDEVLAHAASAYPEECCGALIGPVPADFDRPGRGVEASRARKLSNVWQGQGRDHRYEADPRELARLERELAGSGTGIVAWYHTHPDAPPWPSPFDLMRAWPCYSYLIVSVSEKRAGEARSWQRSADGRDFLPETLEVY